MKLFFIRYTKIIFIYLQLHRLFGWANLMLENLVYMNRFSRWAYQYKNISMNDFPGKWDYQKRYEMYKYVIQQEFLTEKIIYLEFGVAHGQSFRWFMEQNKHVESKFYGFDTFEGLPEDWGPFKKGTFSNANKKPELRDDRGKFYQGLFQQTLPDFLPELDKDARKVIMMDADLFSSTLYVLTMLAPFLQKDDIIFFDEFVVPTHEFKAFYEFTQAYYFEMKLIAAANNYYFVAFKVA